MTRTTTLPDHIVEAIAAADRRPGWNNRPEAIQRFDVDGCSIYVVPYRRWAWRRFEQANALRTCPPLQEHG